MKFLIDNQEYTMTYKNTSKDARNINRTSATHEESGTFTPLIYTKNTIGGNQH